MYRDANGQLWMTFSDKRVNRRRWLNTVSCLARIVLVLCNMAMLLLGICLVVYATIAFHAFEAAEKKLPKHHSAPWFIYAFGAAGVLASFSALVGKAAACNCCGPRGSCLNFYVQCVLALLGVQIVLVLAIFNDSKWRKRFPWDPSGEAAKMRKFIAKNHEFCEWGGVMALLIQVMSLFMVAVINYVQRTLWDHSREAQKLFICDPHLVGRIRSVRELLVAPQIEIPPDPVGPFPGTTSPKVYGPLASYYQEPPKYKHPEPQLGIPQAQQPYYQPQGYVVGPQMQYTPPPPQAPQQYFPPSAPPMQQGNYYQ